MRKRVFFSCIALSLALSICGCGSGDKTYTQSEVDQMIEEAKGSSAVSESLVTESESEAPTESTSTSERTEGSTSIKESPDKYTYYVKDYVGLNLYSVGYTALSEKRNDRYGDSYIQLNLVADDFSYIDFVNDEESLKNYVVVAQSIEPNTEIKFEYEKDSDDNEYDNLVSWSNIEQIDLLVKKTGTELSDNAPELVAINPAPDKYTAFVRNYVGRNAATVGYISISDELMDEYGAGHVELVFATDDGSYLEIDDTDQLSQYVVTGQDVSPNTQITMEFMTDSDGNEYDSLVDNMNISSITLNVTKI